MEVDRSKRTDAEEGKEAKRRKIAPSAEATTGTLAAIAATTTAAVEMNPSTTTSSATSGRAAAATADELRRNSAEAWVRDGWCAPPHDSASRPRREESKFHCTRCLCKQDLLYITVEAAHDPTKPTVMLCLDCKLGASEEYELTCSKYDYERWGNMTKTRPFHTANSKRYSRELDE
jgi:hypothetical protein